MRSVLLVIADLYLSQDASGHDRADEVSLPGLEHVSRFGRRTSASGGWRAWLARQLGGEAITAVAPATLVAATLGSSRNAGSVWLATPVHLITSLTTLHLDRRSILRLRAEEQVALASEFERVFDGAGFALEPLESGDFVLFGPDIELTDALEPARAIGESVAERLRGATIPPELRRLSAELEMWLHDHPLNERRQSRGERPVTGLWLWGGGPSAPLAVPAAALRVSSPQTTIAFGTDAYLHGLCTATGLSLAELPEQLTDIFSYPQAHRAVFVAHIAAMLHSNPHWILQDALLQLDRAYIAPAVQCLHRGEIRQLLIVANGSEWALRARDRFKRWRRARSGLSGLQ